VFSITAGGLLFIILILSIWCWRVAVDGKAREKGVGKGGDSSGGNSGDSGDGGASFGISSEGNDKSGFGQASSGDIIDEDINDIVCILCAVVVAMVLFWNVFCACHH